MRLARVLLESEPAQQKTTQPSFGHSGRSALMHEEQNEGRHCRFSLLPTGVGRAVRSCCQSPNPAPPPLACACSASLCCKHTTAPPGGRRMRRGQTLSGGRCWAKLRGGWQALLVM